MAGMSSVITKKVSIVFCLIYDYYKKPIKHAKISIDGLNERPINKNDGSFVFINLLKGKYVFRITTLDYLPRN